MNQLRSGIIATEGSLVLNESTRPAVAAADSRRRFAETSSSPGKMLYGGTGLSRFTGFYSPRYCAPVEPPAEDQEFSRMLRQYQEEDRRTHRRKDWMKAYYDELVKYSVCTRKTKQKQ
eukprot:RCo038551